MLIVWLPRARDDLQDIAAYYQSVAGKPVADKILQAIVRAASLLADMPQLGHPSSSTDGIYEWQVPRLPYLLPYRVIADRIEILRVFHEAQEPPEGWR